MFAIIIDSSALDSASELRTEVEALNSAQERLQELNAEFCEAYLDLMYYYQANSKSKPTEKKLLEEKSLNTKKKETLIAHKDVLAITMRVKQIFSNSANSKYSAISEKLEKSIEYLENTIDLLEFFNLKDMINTMFSKKEKEIFEILSTSLEGPRKLREPILLDAIHRVTLLVERYKQDEYVPESHSTLKEDALTIKKLYESSETLICNDFMNLSNQWQRYLSTQSYSIDSHRRYFMHFILIETIALHKNRELKFGMRRYISKAPDILLNELVRLSMPTTETAKNPDNSALQAELSSPIKPIIFSALAQISVIATLPLEPQPGRRGARFSS